MKETVFRLYSTYKEWIELIVNTFFVVSSLLSTDEGCKFCNLTRYQTKIFFVAIISAIIAFTLGTLAIKLKKPIQKVFADNDTLKNENDILRSDISFLKQNNKIVLENVLTTMANNKLDFKTLTNAHDRITIYVHDPENKHFIPAASYSNNPKLLEERRSKYPDSEGIIGKTWTNRFFFENKFSDKEKQYVKDQKKVGFFPMEKVKTLSMKSRLYFGHRIDVEINEGIKSIGVIIIESTDQNRFKESFLKDFFKNEEFSLPKILYLLYKNIPNPNLAQEAKL